MFKLWEKTRKYPLDLYFSELWISSLPILMLQLYNHFIAGSLFIRYHNSSGLLFEQFQDLVQKRDSVHFFVFISADLSTGPSKLMS